MSQISPRRIVFCLCSVLLYLTGAATPAQPQQGPPAGPAAEAPVELSTRMVCLSVGVTDKKGRPVTGLTAQDFQVVEDGAAQPLEFFAAEDAPLAVGIVLDRSASMRLDQKMPRALAAAGRFVELSHPEDEFFLLGFAGEVALVQDFARGPEPVRAALAQWRTATGGTALYDAVYSAVERLSRYATPRRKALLVITDGADQGSRRTAEELRRYVGAADVQVFTVGVIGREEDAAAGHMLKELAELSGGRAFFPAEAAELGAVCARIAAELRQQYALAYSPTNPNSDGGWREVEVSVRRRPGRPGLKVCSRRGYFALPPGREQAPVADLK